MRHQCRISRATAVALAIALAACGDDSADILAAPPPQGPALTIAGSTLTDLGTLGGSTSAAYDINGSGVVVGTSTLADGSSRAFRWTEGGGMVALPAGTIVARGVNAAGQVTGRGVFGSATRPFVWTPGAGSGTLKQLPLGTPGASAGEGRDLNGAGQVAGFVTVSGRPRPVLWTPDPAAPAGYRVTHLGDLGGGEGEALGISADGTVVGWALDSRGDRKPFRWTPGAPNSPTGTFAGLLGAEWGGEAYDINDARQISGWVNEHGRRPVRWDPGVNLPTFVSALNSSGDPTTLGDARGIDADGTRLAGASGTQAIALAPGADGLDLSSPAGISAAHRISPDGAWIVGVAGGSAALWRNVVTNSPPEASVGGFAHHVASGDTLVLDARHSTDVDGDALTYSWLSGNREEVLATGPTWSFSASQSRWTFYVVATDDDGRSDSTSFLVYVNTPPVAVIAAGDTVRLAEGEVFLFDGSGSHDPDGDRLRYSWSMGDGTDYPQARVNKAYADNGTYAARLIVMDSLSSTHPLWNRADTADVVVVVGNVAPTATFPSAPGQEGVIRSVALTRVQDPSSTDRGSLEFGFDCGTGFGPSGADSVHVCPAWPDQDTVTLRARLRDKDGGVSTYTRRQYVANVLPEVTAAASATTVQVGDLVTLAPGSSFTDPGADAPWTWFYDWGDGVVTRGGTSAHDLPPNGHRYAAPGTYTLQVSVRDDRGHGHAAPITITVSP